MGLRGERWMVVFVLLALASVNGCAYLRSIAGMEKKEKEENREILVKEEIQFTLEEPRSLIKNYSGMVENDTVDWVWLKPETGFGRYRTAAVGLFKNYSLASSQNLSESLTQQVHALLLKTGVTVAAEGEMVLDGAIVEYIPKGGFIDRIGKILPGDFEKEVITISAEVVIGDASTGMVLCKIRHQASADEPEAALKKIAEDVVRYLSLHP